MCLAGVLSFLPQRCKRELFLSLHCCFAFPLVVVVLSLVKVVSCGSFGSNSFKFCVGSFVVLLLLW